jgi:hypothetical protein
MGMCERRPTVDDISSRRVRDRERPLCILHSGFFQFEHGVHCVPVGGPRVPGLLRIVINVVGTRVSDSSGRRICCSSYGATRQGWNTTQA